MLRPSRLLRSLRSPECRSSDGASSGSALDPRRTATDERGAILADVYKFSNGASLEGSSTWAVTRGVLTFVRSVFRRGCLRSCVSNRAMQATASFFLRSHGGFGSGRAAKCAGAPTRAAR
jgi:hypothetical protein